MATQRISASMASSETSLDAEIKEIFGLLVAEGLLYKNSRRVTDVWRNRKGQELFERSRDVDAGQTQARGGEGV